MGGNRRVVGELDRFFTKLNTSRKEPYSWAGNEPALGIPWEYDYAGAPWRTQDVVRRIATGLYAPTPDGEPGNDDLGALSSWYVWAAIGLYPEAPGSADLALASPLFSHVVITLGDGRQLVLDAPQASRSNRYVQSLQTDGLRASAVCGAKDYRCPWIPASALTSGAHLQFELGGQPNRAWATNPLAAPPSITGANR
jgi:putative alpha-1,2-mannosidase